VLLGRSGLTGKDGQSNGSSDASQGVGSPMQSASPLPRVQDQAQTELMMKVILDCMELSWNMGSPNDC
jgi:hypothetical protein